MQQQYLEHLLTSIEKKRIVSIKEFHKTDLNRNESIEEVNSWYKHIATEVKRNPPTFYVKCIEITEREDSEIQELKYIYFDRTENRYDTTFVKKRSETKFDKE